MPESRFESPDSAPEFDRTRPRRSAVGQEPTSLEPNWAELLLDAEEPILRAIGDNASLNVILDKVCSMIEGLCPDTLCTILLLDPDGQTLRWSAAPSLPARYREAVGTVQVGPEVGSCGAAVFRGEPVIVEDIATDPKWAGGSEIAVAEGLLACWSIPIRSGGGVILGAFGTYCRQARGPSDRELRAIDRSAYLAAIAISRSRTEAKIRAGEDRYRRIIETTHEGIWMIDDHQKITYVNDRMAQMLGYPAEELVGRSAWDFCFPEDHGVGQDSWDRKQKHGENETTEFRIRRKDGSVFWGLFATSPILLEDGGFAGALAMVTDINDRVEAARVLRESEERFRLMTDSMPQIAWIAGRDGTFEYFNRQWYDYTGQTPGESLDQNGWRKLTHPDDVERCTRLARESWAVDGVLVTEFRIKRRDGLYRWHLARSAPVLNKNGQVYRRFGTATDIDDLKRIETELLLNKERLELAQEAGRIGTFDWEIATGRVEWSASQEALFGLETGGFQGRYDQFMGLVHPEDRTRIGEEASRSIANGSEFRTAFRINRPDGSTRWLDALARVLLDESGQPVRMVGVNHDITDRIQLEGELRRRMVELAEADLRKDEFLATLAHELRNPLAPIRSALQLLAQSGEEPSGLEAERLMAERQVVHLARLIDDLMDVARISRGRIELHKRPVELNSVVSQAVEASRSSMAGRGHSLTIDLPTTSIRLEADPTRLEQILDNLLANAIKYTEPGGLIRLSATIEGPEVAIVVGDTGIGIEPSMISRVFEKFVQAERRSHRSQGGLGIGLSLVKSLVELHGGRIEGRSPGPGLGSEFEIRLPRLLDPASADPDYPPVTTTPSQAAGPPATRRILVVDDNVDAALSLAKLLKRIYRHVVAVAHDGPTALEQALTFEPDLVLLDLGMPGMDGYEVARQLRARDGFATTLLVALTGWGQDSDRFRSHQAGFDRHLVKPVGPEELESVLSLNRS